MANVELQLISNLLRDADLVVLRRMGFNAALLQTDEAREMFRWISDECSNPQNSGIVPSLERLQRRFPAFDYCPVRDPTLALAKEIIDNNVSAGIRAAIGEIDDFLEHGVDPQVVLGGYLPQFRELSLQGSNSKQLLMSGAAALLREDYTRMQQSGGITGIPYPWAPLNQATAGMQPEDFVVIYGRPKNMKTFVGLAMCAYAYNAGYRVLAYSKEMPDITLARRTASIICEVDYGHVKSGTLSAEDEAAFFATLDHLSEWENATNVSGHKAAMTFLSDKGMRTERKGTTVDVLAAEAERFEPDLILVDGFYLMLDGRTNQRSREWKQVSNISSDLKGMAQQLGIPVIGTTQANRGASKTQGDDTDEVGYADAIGQDCDLMTRVFLSKNLATGHPKIMLTFPGTRDAVLNPFVINAWPGKDFSLMQASVDVAAFLRDKQDHDAADTLKTGMPPSGGTGRDRFKQEGRRKRSTTRIRE